MNRQGFFVPGRKYIYWNRECYKKIKKIIRYTIDYNESYAVIYVIWDGKGVFLIH